MLTLTYSSPLPPSPPQHQFNSFAEKITLSKRHSAIVVIINWFLFSFFSTLFKYRWWSESRLCFPSEGKFISFAWWRSWFSLFLSHEKKKSSLKFLRKNGNSVEHIERGINWRLSAITMAASWQGLTQLLLNETSWNRLSARLLSK